MFEAEILPGKNVPLDISQGEGAPSLTFPWLGGSRQEMPFEFPWNPAEAPPLGAVGVKAASRENLFLKVSWNGAEHPRTHFRHISKGGWTCPVRYESEEGKIPPRTRDRQMALLNLPCIFYFIFGFPIPIPSVYFLFCLVGLVREDQEQTKPSNMMREPEPPALTAFKLPVTPASKLGLQTSPHQLGTPRQSQISPSLGFFPWLWDAAPLAGTTLGMGAASKAIDILFLIRGAIKRREDYRHHRVPVPRLPRAAAFISSAWAVPSMN